jgi:hypothetical protein
MIKNTIGDFLQCCFFGDPAFGFRYNSRMAGVTETEFTVRVPNNTDNKARNLTSYVSVSETLKKNCNFLEE